MCAWLRPKLGVLFFHICVYDDGIQDTSIMAWNVHGVVNRVGRCHARDMVQTYHPSLFCLFETHSQFEKVEKFWHDLGYDLVHVVEAEEHLEMCGFYLQGFPFL